MVRVTSSFTIISAGLIASVVAGPLRIKRSDDLTAVFLPSGSSLGAACQQWRGDCVHLSGYNTTSICTEDKSVTNAALVMCSADGHIITGDVIEAFDWQQVYPQTAKTAQQNDAPVAVYFPAGSRGYHLGCQVWDGECVHLAGYNTTSVCKPDAAVANAAFVQCSANGNVITGDVIEALGWQKV